MRNIGTLLLTAVCLLFIVFPAFGQSNNDGVISGVVVDGETGETLIAVNIVIQGTQMGVASDLNGQYRFNKVPAGNYTLVASSIGYTKQTIKDVAVRPGDVTKLDLKLMPDVYELEEVVVEAKVFATLMLLC